MLSSSWLKIPPEYCLIVYAFGQRTGGKCDIEISTKNGFWKRFQIQKEKPIFDALRENKEFDREFYRNELIFDTEDRRDDFVPHFVVNKSCPDGPCGKCLAFLKPQIKYSEYKIHYPWTEYPHMNLSYADAEKGFLLPCICSTGGDFCALEFMNLK